VTAPGSIRVHRLVHPFVVRPRLPLAAAIGALVYLVLPDHWRVVTRLVDAWLVFVLVYLAFIALMVGRSTVASIRRRAPLYDLGAGVILLLTTGAAVASIGAVVAEIAIVKHHGVATAFFLAYSAFTVTLSWCFVHTMFALHYAHDYYAGTAEGRRPPLTFPGTEEPGYGDFLYFSFVIGCACATADVNITDRAVRRLALVHGVVAFFFNAAIVAMFINLAAGLLGS
jgi:uncharacterized membrane protein